MFKRKKSQNKIVVLMDFENLMKNIELPPPERFSLTEEFDNLFKQINQEVGKIVNVFVFAPPHLALLWGGCFHDQGFFTILCPKIRTKTGEEEDTTDSIISEFGKKILAQQDITHLCLASGDKDFIPLLKEAIRQGVKIIIVAANLRSLATDLIRLTDRKPSGERMVYIFSPIQKE